MTASAAVLGVQHCCTMKEQHCAQHNVSPVPVLCCTGKKAGDLGDVVDS
jgi:hypothetical protein